MTKSKKDKNAGAVRKIARRTVGLMLRVGDVLEAVAADAEATAPAPAASTASVAVALPVAPAPIASPLPVVAVVAEAPAQEAVVVVVAIEPVDPGARAVAAIEAYATQHNLRAADMPGLGVLVEALAGATDGAELTEARVRTALDEQMRIHLRALGARPLPG